MIHRFGEIEVDTREMVLRRAGEVVPLKPRAFALLEFLIANPQRVVTKAEMIEAVWDGRAVSDNAMATAVRDIRRAIGDNDREGGTLRTIYGRGLRWMAMSEAASEADAFLDRLPRGGITGRVVAVLPFESFSLAATASNLAAFLTRDIIVQLSRFRDVRALSLNSSRALQGAGLTAREIGERLGASYLVDGSVLVDEPDARVSVQVTECVEGTHLWADHFDIHTDRVREGLERVSSSIAASIVPLVNDHVRKRAMTKPDDELTAYDCYLRGRARMQTLEPEKQDEAIALFERAMELDPSYPDAFAALSISLDIKSYAVLDDPAELEAVRVRGRKLAEAALAADPTMPIAWVAMSRCHYAANEIGEAIIAAQRSVELNPLLAWGHYALGFATIQDNRAEQSVSAFDAGLSVSPHDTYRWGMMAGKACALVLLTRYEEAIEWSRRAQREPGARFFAYLGELCALGHLGLADEAAAALERARSLDARIGPDLVQHIFPLTNSQARTQILDGLRLAGVAAIERGP